MFKHHLLRGSPLLTESVPRFPITSDAFWWKVDTRCECYERIFRLCVQRSLSDKANDEFSIFPSHSKTCRSIILSHQMALAAHFCQQEQASRMGWRSQLLQCHLLVLNVAFPRREATIQTRTRWPRFKRLRYCCCSGDNAAFAQASVRWPGAEGFL